MSTTASIFLIGREESDGQVKVSLYQVNVFHPGLDLLMPREFLDCSHVHASGSQTRTERVTHCVDNPILSAQNFALCLDAHDCAPTQPRK